LSFPYSWHRGRASIRARSVSDGTLRMAETAEDVSKISIIPEFRLLIGGSLQSGTGAIKKNSRRRRTGVCLRFLLASRMGAVVHDFYLFHGEQTAAHHRIEHRQEGLDFLFAVYNFNDDGQIEREAEDLCRMEQAGTAESHRAAQDGGAGQAHF